MSALEQYIITNHTLILLGLGWLFSAIVSTMPPIKPDAGYWTTWLHNLLQVLGANLNKVKSSKEGA
jgi:hypothetical protein